MSRGLLKDESGGEDNSPGVNNTATQPDIIPEHDKKTCPDKANDTAPCCHVYFRESSKRSKQAHNSPNARTEGRNQISS